MDLDLESDTFASVFQRVSHKIRLRLPIFSFSLFQMFAAKLKTFKRGNIQGEANEKFKVWKKFLLKKIETYELFS